VFWYATEYHLRRNVNIRAIRPSPLTGRDRDNEALLKARVHSVYGGSGDGKTWFMLWVVKRCLERGEKVVLFDAENGQRIISECTRERGPPPSRRYPRGLLIVGGEYLRRTMRVTAKPVGF
jgi:KaiC/GvpD/RAD55 family RecA-like ATPase